MLSINWFKITNVVVLKKVKTNVASIQSTSFYVPTKFIYNFWIMIKCNFKSNQINSSFERCWKALQVLSVVLRVEQLEHYRKGKRVLHQVQQTVERQKCRIENQKLLKVRISNKSFSIDFAVRQVVGVQNDQPGEPVRVVLDQAGAKHRSPIVAGQR